MRSKGQTKNKNINYLIGSTPLNKQSPKSSILKQDKTFIKQRERDRERVKECNKTEQGYGVVTAF